ncbi:MAG: MBL fold metallo-hydrolase [bacterium]
MRFTTDPGKNDSAGCCGRCSDEALHAEADLAGGRLIAPQIDRTLFGRRFKNPNPGFEDPAFSRVARWLIERFCRDGRTSSFGMLRPLRTSAAVSSPTERLEALMRLTNGTLTSLTWIGHSTFHMQIEGLGVLTDPVWSPRVFPRVGPQRVFPPPWSLEQLGRIDLVLLSHDHYDHLDLPTLRRIGPKPLYCVPLGLKPVLARAGLCRVQEFSWWDTLCIASLRVRCVPAQHFSVRGLLDRNATLWAGWCLEGRQHRVYFAGDTGFYQRQFEEIAKVCAPIHAAILPVGAYRPRWLMGPVHMDPLEALEAARMLDARWLVPCHWGTFKLSDEPLDEPIEVLGQALRDGSSGRCRAWLPVPGQTKYLAG